MKLAFLPRPWARSVFATVALFTSTLFAARGFGAETAARMEEIAQKYVAEEQFTGAVLVARRGVALFDRAYGLANVEWEIPNTPTTHFRIGSITKQFTAVGVLLLEERGKLKLTDPVSAHLPDAPAAWSKITLHHLLTHTSGISNVTSDPEFILWKNQPTTILQMVGRFRDLPLDFPAGERHEYSNSNYLVLGLIIEKITRQRFGDFLVEQVLNPLGLNNTGLDSNQRILPRRASGYVRRRDQVLNAPYSDMTVPHAAGAMYSTTHDLWRWAEGVFGDKLLTAAARTKLLTPARDNYALGLRVYRAQGRQVIQHGGNIAGFSSFLSHYPEQGVTVVVLANMNTRIIGDFGRQLARAAFEGADDAEAPRPSVAVPPATLEAYCGVYEVRPGLRVTVRLENVAFTAQPSDEQARPLLAESETKFYFTDVDTEVEFVRGVSGKATHLVMMRDGRVRRASRIAD